MTSDERTLVIIPTYDERENLPTTAARVRSACPDADILVVDDASPDGTGALADELAATDPRVHVLHRAATEGLGRPTSPDSPGGWTTASTSWSRWTPTAHINQRSCPACCERSPTPMWCWARDGWPAVKYSTGRYGDSCSAAPATSTPGLRSGCGDTGTRGPDRSPVV